jgi:hypothetical protein
MWAAHGDAPIGQGVDEACIAHPHFGQGAQVGDDGHVDCESRIGQAHIDTVVDDDDPEVAALGGNDGNVNWRTTRRSPNPPGARNRRMFEQPRRQLVDREREAPIAARESAT